MKLLDAYKGLARCNIGNGSNASFWHDCCLSHKFPHLYSFTKNIDVTVSYAGERAFLEYLFHLPLSREAYQEFLQLEDLWDDIHQLRSLEQNDSWSYIWGNGFYSSKQAYIFLIGTNQCSPQFAWIWKSSCQAKHTKKIMVASS